MSLRLANLGYIVRPSQNNKKKKQFFLPDSVTFLLLPLDTISVLALGPVDPDHVLFWASSWPTADHRLSTSIIL
jgi:hypothetical protein